MAPSTPEPVDGSEATAQFRLAVIGPLVGREFDHGELCAEIRALSERRWRPPDSDVSRTYSVPTIERWYYAYREHGIAALHPKRRSDHGRGRSLTDEQRELLLAIRREYPSAGAPTVLDALVRQGVLESGQLDASTLNRLYASHGLRRRSRKSAAGPGRQRRRWQAEAPGVLWHADVCHGPDLLAPDGARTPVRVHAILDDASRYVVALEVHEREREVDMLGLFARAVDRVGAPERLYLDNGATYRGDGLATVCARLSIALVHAQPYDPEARGKMERLWRTAREQCLDFVGEHGMTHDVTVRLNAWLDQRYHTSPHSSLMGGSPLSVWESSERRLRRPSADEMRDAFAVRDRRRVRKDGTLDVDGVTYELDAGFLAGRNVQLVRCLPPLDVDHPPRVEHEGRTWMLHPVDPVRNASRGRKKLETKPVEPTGFDPATTLLDQAAGRLNNKNKDKR